MLKFALKNMLVKKIQVILITLSIVLSCGVGVLAYNVSSQVSDGITSNAAYYSAIIGPSGSATQLVMNTIYYTDEPLGTIPYELVSKLAKDSRVKKAIPFAMADSYKGYNLIGTTKDLLENKQIDGNMFSIPKDVDSGCEVVIGASVAENTGLKIGDSFYTSHAVGSEHHTSFIVVGILEETHTVYDSEIFTHLKSLWLVHEEEEHDHLESEEHEFELENMVCAIIIMTDSPTSATALVSEYDNSIFTDHEGNAHALSAIEPMAIVRNILSEVNTTKYIVYILCAIILIMNIMIISVITLLNMYYSVEEISLMRLIGVSMRKINLLYIIQNSIIGFMSIILSFVLSRFALSFMQDYVRSMGAVLNMGKVYPLEFIIMILVFIIAVLPTIIMNYVLSKKDSIRG